MGRGIRLIQAKEPATEFEEAGAMLFVARFRRNGLQKGVARETDITPGKSSGKTENQVLPLLSEKPGMTISELAEALTVGMTQRRTITERKIYNIRNILDR